MNELVISQSQYNAFVLTEVLNATGCEYVRDECLVKNFDESYLFLFRQYSYDEAGKWWVFLNHIEEWLIEGKPTSGFFWSFLLYAMNLGPERVRFVCMLLDFEPLEVQDKLRMFKKTLLDVRSKAKVLIDQRVAEEKLQRIAQAKLS
jgi:hypothetical protein